MNRARVIISIGQLAALTVATLAPCAVAQLDLSAWTLVDPYDRWSYHTAPPTVGIMEETASSGTVGPGWVVSNFNLLPTASFSITVRVASSSDDDIFGIAFAYQDNDNFYLLDWKRTAQSFNWGDSVTVNDDLAERGLKIKRVVGGWTRDGLWGGTDGEGVSTIAGPVDRAWAFSTDYVFEVDLSPGRIVVRLDNEAIFDVLDDTFQGGRVTFFGFSQDNLHFFDVAADGRACPADFDGDGFLTGLDFDAYVAAFESGDPSSDFDGDGFVTSLDFDTYVTAFEAGC